MGSLVVRDVYKRHGLDGVDDLSIQHLASHLLTFCLLHRIICASTLLLWHIDHFIILTRHHLLHHLFILDRFDIKVSIVYSNYCIISGTTYQSTSNIIKDPSVTQSSTIQIPSLFRPSELPTTNHHTCYLPNPNPPVIHTHSGSSTPPPYSFP